MKYAICNECNYIFENKDPGIYHCPSCQKDIKFFRFQAFCGAKPSEIHRVHNDEIDSDSN